MAKNTFVPKNPTQMVAAKSTIGVNTALASPAILSYNWDGVPEDSRERVKANAGLIIRKSRAMSDDLMDIGEALTEIKNATPHGEFANICERVLDIPTRTAENIMNIYDQWKDNPQALRLFSDRTTLGLLSGPSVSDDTRQQAIAEATEARAQGKTLPRARVQAIVREARQAPTNGHSDTGSVGRDESIPTFVPANAAGDATIDGTATLVVEDDDTPPAYPGAETERQYNTAKMQLAVTQLYGAIQALEIIEQETGQDWCIAKGYLENAIAQNEKNNA